MTEDAAAASAGTAAASGGPAAASAGPAAASAGTAAGPAAASAAAAEDPLARAVAAPGVRDHGTKPFGEFTLADVRARSAELSAAVGFGTARVAGVARGWAELGRVMESDGAAIVAELGPERGAEFARKLWVVPPGGSLL